MAKIDRRTFLRATTAIAAGAVAPDLTLAASNNRELMGSPSPSIPHVTKILASYIVSARYEDLPANVRKEGLRTLLNWVGVAVGGSHHETIEHCRRRSSAILRTVPSVYPWAPRTFRCDERRVYQRRFLTYFRLR